MFFYEGGLFMNYSKSPLFGLTRKRDLNNLIKVKTKNNNKYNLQYKPYIEKKPKKRLIEAPKYNIKMVQKKIKRYLDCIDYPNNVFSGIKGRSYIDNAYFHIKSNYFLKMDMSKFFPNTSREKIFNFYNKKMKIATDVAAILTDLSSVNITNMMSSEIRKFINEKGIKYTNHLPSGSPISSILSYLTNIDMFDELNELAKKNDCIVSFYVDDIIFSSKNKISRTLLKKAEKIINKHGQIVNKDKTKTYITDDYKKITGCVIKNYQLIIPNKTRYKIAKILRQENYTDKEINSILGLINNAHLFDKNKYNDLQQKIKNKCLKTKKVC